MKKVMIYLSVAFVAVIAAMSVILWRSPETLGKFNQAQLEQVQNLSLDELDELLANHQYGRLVRYEKQQLAAQRQLDVEASLVICHARWSLDRMTGEFSDESMMAYRRLHDRLLSHDMPEAQMQVREYLVRAWMVREAYGMVTSLLRDVSQSDPFQFYQMAAKSRYKAADVKQFYGALDEVQLKALPVSEVVLAVSLEALNSLKLKGAFSGTPQFDLYASYDMLARRQRSAASRHIESYSKYLLEEEADASLLEEMRVSCLQLERLGRLNDQINLLWHYRMHLEPGMRDRLLRLLVGVENFRLIRAWLVHLKDQKVLTLNEQLIARRCGIEMNELSTDVYGQHAESWNLMFQHYPAAQAQQLGKFAEGDGKIVLVNHSDAALASGLSALIAENPKNPHLHDLYADLMIARKQPYAAIQSARISYAAIPHSHRLGVRFLTLLIEQGQFDQAFRLIAQMKSRFPESQTVRRLKRMNQYAAYLWTGKQLPDGFNIKFEGMKKAAHKPSRTDEEIKSLMQGTESDRAKARLVLSKMVKRWPDHQEARLLLAEVLLGSQSESLALSHLESFVERQPYRVMSAWRVLLVAWHRDQIRDVKQLKRCWQLVTPNEVGAKRSLELLESWLQNFPKNKETKKVNPSPAVKEIS